jgi:hypothetical protein
MAQYRDVEILYLRKTEYQTFLYQEEHHLHSYRNPGNPRYGERGNGSTCCASNARDKPRAFCLSSGLFLLAAMKSSLFEVNPSPPPTVYSHCRTPLFETMSWLGTFQHPSLSRPVTATPFPMKSRRRLEVELSFGDLDLDMERPRF